MIVHKTYRYKLRPTKKQSRLLGQTLDICRELFNLALEQRRYRHIDKFAQMRQLTELKALFPEYKAVHVQVLQNVIKRLDRAFENFFRRCKIGGRPGYPRFKSKDRYDSFQFNNIGFSLNGNRLSLSKIGNVRVHLSRNLPVGAVIKCCSIKRSTNGWFATITFACARFELPANDKAVGIDVGVENLAALSDGTFIENPRFYEYGGKHLRIAQRRVARRNKGSNRRRKAVVLLRKTHQRIADRRLDYLHKQTTSLVAKFGTIAIENLNIKGLAQGILSKQIHDASWATFFNLLAYKAEDAGRTVIGVDCKFTSQMCPSCGNKLKKALSERRHRCLVCGYSAHRDTAAAQVILGRACPSDAKIGDAIPCLV